MSIKLNVNIRTLLNNCEELSQFEVNHVRLRPLTDSLHSMINELRQNDSKCKHLADYEDRLNKLKKHIGYTNQLSINEKRSELNESQSMENCQDMLRQSRQLKSSQIYMDLRKKLIPEVGGGVRYRQTIGKSKLLSSSGSEIKPETINEFINSSEKRKHIKTFNCEYIADQMLSITQNLREQTETANRIIRSDTDMVAESNDAANDNIYALNRESRKLQSHSTLDRNFWVWLMIAFVLITFIGTVIFMKIVKKK